MAPVEGFWGKQTATIDWCEDNYKITQYIAEFWNTITNFIFIIPTLTVLAIAIQQNHENRYKWCHIGVISVGIGSWCFHMTLLYSMQLLDELPMIYSACFLLYCQLETTSPENHHNRSLQLFFIILSIGITLIYVPTKHVLFFQACYGIMVISMVFITLRIIMKLQHSRTLYVASVTTYVLGVIVWLLDQRFCGQLRVVRSDVMPQILSPFTELHAWWHLLAGVGTYLSVFFSAHTRYLYLKKNPKIHFWMGFWPYLYVPSLANSKLNVT
ncbi:alkaline ceramidase 3-like [Ylistrum balloti]|uniref:alkaline ceramidase 3-like n=1 Tax=Ylistrum balloti TaxID=509963 RepID=UPI002905A3B3|nr:alkaline ceramidase 3-like [Ylistrum balloti]